MFSAIILFVNLHRYFGFTSFREEGARYLCLLSACANYVHEQSQKYSVGHKAWGYRDSCKRLLSQIRGSFGMP